MTYNFARRIQASIEPEGQEVDAVTYKQFLAWEEKEKQQYLQQHPNSKFGRQHSEGLTETKPYSQIRRERNQALHQERKSPDSEKHRSADLGLKRVPSKQEREAQQSLPKGLPPEMGAAWKRSTKGLDEGQPLGPAATRHFQDSMRYVVPPEDAAKIQDLVAKDRAALQNAPTVYDRSNPDQVAKHDAWVKNHEKTGADLKSAMADLADRLFHPKGAAAKAAWTDALMKSRHYIKPPK